MNTLSNNSPLEQALLGIPATFRKRLISAYMALKEAAAEARFDVAGLQAGKFCETCIRFLQDVVTGSHTPFGKKIPNFADECRRLITASSNTVESLRVLLPRGLVFLYTMRNKRGIGHVAGDVDANAIDIATMTRVADWIICELIRVYHALSLEEAQDLIDNISIRDLPSVWEIEGKKRVLAKGLTIKQQTLLLLYSDPGNVVLAEDLCSWVEYAKLSVYRRDILRPLHKARLIEFDGDLDSVHLSPLGAREVENTILHRCRGAT